LGEPRHATPHLIQRAMIEAITRQPSGLSAYPATAGEASLRQAFADWLERRYRLKVLTR
jgi:N-succinyldiaminopimelate aminotransferase